MRLIDADALIESICWDECERKHEDCDYTCSSIAPIVNAPTVGGWISVKDALPKNQVTVLIVKELKSGQRNIGLGYCIPEYKIHDYTTGEDRVEPYWVCGGNNHVIYWMELPKMPKE